MIVRRFKKVGRNDPCPCGAEDIFLDVYELYDLYQSGKTLDELGELIDKSRKTISRLFIKHNLAIRNKSEAALGEKNSSFIDGPTYTKDGYITIWNGSERVLEHRFVIEQEIKRSLKTEECIHHINGVKTDNRLENLQIVSHIEHRTLHKLPDEIWSRDYEHCTKCGSTEREHAGHGLCTRCNQYDRTISKRGYECEYDAEGKRIFSQDHIEKLKQARILVVKNKKHKHCSCYQEIQEVKYINLSEIKK